MEKINEGKLIIFSAPSGSGKSTIIAKLLDHGFKFGFSISATSRAPRGTEKNGVEYWFLSADEFKRKITNDEFVEYEEVYPGCFYGTLRSEVDKILKQGIDVLLDVDVKGALNIKKQYASRALLIFVQPPSIDVLKERLVKRATDSEETIAKRIAKAEYEMSFADKFDQVVVNDNLDIAVNQAVAIIEKFIKG